MFGVAYEMAALPVRLAWRGLRWWWKRRAERKRERRWQPMAKPLGNVTPPVPRVPGLTARTWARMLATVGMAEDSPEVKAARAALNAEVITAVAGPQAMAQSPVTAALLGKEAPGSTGNGPTGDDDLPELARFHSREGDGFKIIFHFLLKRQRVRRTVWLDFARLERRIGREQTWAMRARLGHAQMRFAVDRPGQPLGRIELPEARLALESTRTQKARSFMLETLDAVSAMIDAGGIALVSGRFKALPPGDGPVEGLSATRGRSQARAPAADPVASAPAAPTPTPASAPATAQQGELALDAGTPAAASGEVPPMPPILPDPADDAAGLPRGVVPEHVCTGILAGAGVTERTDASGRNYRIFYADVDVGGRISRQTGIDLERALQDAKAYVGMQVRLQHLGYVPAHGGRHRRKVWHATVLNG